MSGLLAAAAKSFGSVARGSIGWLPARRREPYRWAKVTRRDQAARAIPATYRRRRGWAGPEQRGTATVSDARSRLVILGIGDDGLAGMTESARRILMDS